MKMTPFLTADWRHLINLTYPVAREHLLPHVPAGLELDLWQERPHVSLVAFEFLRTKIHGVKIPLHVNFPEINLRFYVRRGERRGVVFLREMEHFFKEHEFGYGRDRAGNTLCYRVEHPVWEVFPVTEYRLQWDFGKLYGPAWEFLNTQQPVCVLVAKGSADKVIHPQQHSEREA